MGPKKSGVEQESFRKHFGQVLSLHPEWTQKDIYSHFKKEGLYPSTIFRLIRRHEEGLPMKTKPRSGRPPKIMDKKGIKRLNNMMDGNDKISQRVAASKFNCSQPYVCKTLKKKTEVRCYKKQKMPSYKEGQEKSVQRASRTLVRKTSGLEFVIDDEHFFPLSKNQIPGNDTFYTKDKKKAPPALKYKFCTKYEKKLMMWIAISPKGISRPVFHPSGLGVTSKIYLDKCLKPVLIPFLHEHYPDGGYIFWPDKASSHYAIDVREFLEEENIPTVPRKDNPTSLPQARPIENFFGYLDSLVYKGGWKAKNLPQLQRRVKYCLKKVDKTIVQKMMTKVRTLLRTTADHGPYSIPN